MNENEIIGYSAGVHGQGRWWACYCIMDSTGKILRKRFRPLDRQLVTGQEAADHEAFFDALESRAALGLHGVEILNREKLRIMDRLHHPITSAQKRLINQAQAELKEVPTMESENTRELSIWL